MVSKKNPNTICTNITNFVEGNLTFSSREQLVLLTSCTASKTNPTALPGITYSGDQCQGKGAPSKTRWEAILPLESLVPYWNWVSHTRATHVWLVFINSIPAKKCVSMHSVQYSPWIYISPDSITSHTSPSHFIVYCISEELATSPSNKQEQIYRKVTNGTKELILLLQL